MTVSDTSPRLSPWTGSFFIILVIVICAAILWVKLDWLGKRLEDQVAGSRPTASRPADLPREFPGLNVEDLQRSSPGTAEFDSDGVHARGPVHSHGPFTGSSHPPAGDLVLLPEWTPCRFVAVALPSLRTYDAGFITLLGDLAETLLLQTGVTLIVVIEQNDVTARTRFDELVSARGLDRRRVRFFEVKKLDSIWIRDYGPLFVLRREDRKMFVVDAAYRDIRLAVAEGFAGLDHAVRPADDLVPIYFSTFLNLAYLHPGFALNGGDVYSDGQGVLYTSEETLHLNTGDREFLTRAFRAYLGVGRVHYLQPLPGPTVKHVDMIFKLTSPTTCVVGQYRAPETVNDLASLQRAAAAALDENAESLGRAGLRVVRVPMPDIEKITKWDYFGRVFSSDDREARLEDLAEGAQVSPDAMREKLLSTYTYTYRTYLNSMLIVAAPPSETAQGEKHARNVRPISLLLVPRVRAASAEALESQVERAYRDAYGASLEVVFVRAETLAHANGSLRCIACPVPDGALPALADSTFGGN